MAALVMVNPTDITPTLEQVAERIHVRTRDVDGVLVGTFTAATRPDATTAAGIASRAARHVALKLGVPGTTWDGDLLATATDIAALYAALEIENSFYGDGIDDGEGLADQLGRMFREQLEALLETARDNQVGGWRFASIRQHTTPPIDDTTV